MDLQSSTKEVEGLRCLVTYSHLVHMRYSERAGVSEGAGISKWAGVSEGWGRVGYGGVGELSALQVES